MKNPNPRIKNLVDILYNTYNMLQKPYNAKLINNAVQDIHGDWCIPWPAVVIEIQRNYPQTTEDDIYTAYLELFNNKYIVMPGIKI